MRRHPFLWTLSRIRRRLPAIVLMTAVGVANAILGVLFALGSRGVIDAGVSGQPELFRRACLIQGGIICGLLLTLTLQRHLYEYLTAQLDRDWKKRLFADILEGDYSAVSQFHTGELINRLNNDVRTLNGGILSALPQMAALAARLFAALAVLAALEPGFTAVISLAGGAVILTTTILRKKLKQLHKLVSQEDGRVSGFLQETLEKLLMVQAMDVSGEMRKRASELMDIRFQAHRRRKNVSLAANTGVAVLSYGAGFAALVWCAGKLLTGQLSFGTLTAVIQLVNQLQTPIVNLSAVIPQYIAMTAAAERLMELEALPRDEAPGGELPGELYTRMTGIRAEGLCFSYDRDAVLREASFLLPAGTFSVITGPSGIGKSTLLKLMLGIFHPDAGTLCAVCGGRDITLDRSTRKLFAYVPQGNLLLSGTLRENLTITAPNATAEQISNAVYVSAMDEFLPQLPRGLDTVIGENGAGLSEGQAQRLSLARAILSGAPILLLDEGTSALDAATERLVLERIRALPNRTCIAVTHRTAALELCDWRLEVADGKILAHPAKH